MTRLCLIRHGQTDWNLEGRYQGQSDVPLNAIGRAEARQAADKLSAACFAGIYASDLARARETAEIIGDRLRLPITVDFRLREINQGEWEGQLVEVLRQRYRQLWQARIIDPANVRPPGGETVREVAERVFSALDAIVQSRSELPFLVVSHGLAIATALCRVNGIPIAQAYSRIPENAMPVWIEWNGLPRRAETARG
jgi:broad specificity phosphatase PhoE